jgi:hypothetical protein
MHTEDDIRAALRVLADDAPNADDILSAYADERERRGQRSAAPGRIRRRRSLRLLVAPVAAAAAVIGVVATAVAIGTGGQPGLSAPAPGHGLPPYYVLITTSPRRFGLETLIGDTRTGATLATVHPPAGYWFIEAAPGAGNDSFLLLANSHHRGSLQLFLLRFRPADRRTSLTRLPITAPIYTGGLAMSPNGTEVAVASGTNTGKVPSELSIYKLSGRLIRRWQEPGRVPAVRGRPARPSNDWQMICLLQEMPCLSWGASGYLAFTWFDGTNAAVEGIRLIPAAARSGSLLGASRLIVPFTTAWSNGFVMSGDGATIATEVGNSDSTIEEIATATGKVTAQYRPTRRISFGPVFWSNWTGSELVVGVFPRRGRSWPGIFGTLTHGRLAPLGATSASSMSLFDRLFGFAF